MKQQYIHTSSYVRTWSCYNPNDLQQQCQLKVVYDNLEKKKKRKKTIVSYIINNKERTNEQNLGKVFLCSSFDVNL